MVGCSCCYSCVCVCPLVWRFFVLNSSCRKNTALWLIGWRRNCEVLELPAIALLCPRIGYKIAGLSASAWRVQIHPSVSHRPQPNGAIVIGNVSISQGYHDLGGSPQKGWLRLVSHTHYPSSQLNNHQVIKTTILQEGPEGRCNASKPYLTGSWIHGYGCNGVTNKGTLQFVFLFFSAGRDLKTGSQQKNVLCLLPVGEMIQFD